MLEWTGERYLPELSSPEISYEHWHRYLYATQFVKDKVVLDVACGEGYGAYLLSKSASRVVGVDIDREVIHHAASKYVAENIEFRCGAADDISIEGESVFDVIVSFETIEHMSRKRQESFLKQVKRLLKPGGLFIASTPNKFNYHDTQEYENEFHVAEFYLDELKNFLNSCFLRVKLLGQKIYPTSYIWTPGTEKSKFMEYRLEYSDHGFHPSDTPKTILYAIVICSDAEIDAPPTSLMIDLSETIMKLKDQHISNLTHAVREKDEYIASLRDALHDKAKALRQREEETAVLHRQLSEKETALEKRRGKLVQLQDRLFEKEAMLRRREEEFVTLEAVLSEKENALEQKVEAMANLENTLSEKEALLQERGDKIASLEDGLARKQDELRNIHNSTSWRFLRAWNRLRNKILHLGKKRRSRRSRKQRYLRKIRKARLRLNAFGERAKLAFLAVRFRQLKPSPQEARVQKFEAPDCAPCAVMAACTIVSKNYLAHAITLGRSFKSHNPDSDYYVLLCDLLEDKHDLDLYLQLTSENIRLIPIYELRSKLDIPDLEAMLFKYNLLEMNTAIKPFFLEYLLLSGYQKVVYFDPDILILDRIDEVDELLETYNVVLTPHILKDIPDDGRSPSNVDIMKSGIYNLGFIAVKDSEETRGFLRWWQQKLVDNCFADLKNGLHVDQKWVDFVPALFEKVFIQKKSSYNVAYWNLHERQLTFRDGRWYVGDEPVLFFHFSGILLENLGKISKHQDRFRLKDFPDLHRLFKHYRNELLKNNFLGVKSKSYYFGKLPGTTIKIPDFMRRMYGEILSNMSNPWNPDAVEAICNYVNEQTYPPVTRLWLSIYNARTDLQRAFPSLEKSEENRFGLSNWIKKSLKRAHNLSDIFVNPDHSNFRDSVQRNEAGVNLWGYFGLTTGVAGLARNLMYALQRVGTPVLLCNIPSDGHDSLCDDDRQCANKYFTRNALNKINIITANADQLPHIYEHFGREKFDSSYNIGFWSWEIADHFPFESSFNLVDEIWYFSDFPCQTYRKYTEKPVIKMPLYFRPDWDYLVEPEEVRRRIGISQDDFVFIFAFDFRSSFERKNPDGVVKAFLKAFEKKESGVKLIIKSQNSKYYPTQYRYLQDFIRDSGMGNIIFMDELLSREDYISLLNAADCFVSLHRSEGLGLGIAEVMYLGKCVISTNYGGSLEFTNKENSLLVDYELAPIKEDFGPYEAGQLWAEPNVDQCAEYMKMVYENREWANTIGAEGSRHVKRISATSANHIAKRLSEIMEKI